jgi:hypothetical protein
MTNRRRPPGENLLARLTILAVRLDKDANPYKYRYGNWRAGGIILAADPRKKNPKSRIGCHSRRSTRFSVARLPLLCRFPCGDAAAVEQVATRSMNFDPIRQRPQASSHNYLGTPEV